MNELQWNTINSYNQTAVRFNDTIPKLSNYNHTYDVIAEALEDGNSILDLACGSGQISQYISDKRKVAVTGVDLSDAMLELAKEKIPSGTFYKDSIIDFSPNTQYHAVIIGFGLPYLDKEQVLKCLRNAVNNTLKDYYLYISFMEGEGYKIEKTSFGGDCDFLIYYHQKEFIKQLLKDLNVGIIKEYELKYEEKDGSITKDIVIIGKKIAHPQQAAGN